MANEKTYYKSTVYQMMDDGGVYDYRLDVTDYGGLFTVEQIDLENGAPWNATPVRSFSTLKEAIEFASPEVK